MKKHELKQLIKEEIKKVLKENTNINKLLQFTNDNLDELKEYFKNYLIWDGEGLEEDDIEERVEMINNISKMIIDSLGDAVTPDQEIGVSIKYANDIDDKFLGQEKNKPDYFKLNGTEMAAVWYNI